jgi:hypothetical protein
MKTLFFTTGLLLCSFLKAQNLVPNPSFEDTVNCPFQSGDMDKASGWTSFCGSPDYFKSCNQSDWGVPTNICGYQMAASGNAYAGFITYYSGGINEREFPACTLLSPLSIGTKYYVSFKVALSLENIANPANCASNGIGAKFATNPYICDALINNNPSVYTDSIVKDSTNWTRITGSFIADSAYYYLVIGNFFDDANTDTVKYFNSWWDDFAYYYLDDVCVGTDSAFVYSYNGVTGISHNRANPMVSFYPNPFKDFLFIQTSFNQEMTISIYNLLGEQLLSTSQTSTKSFSIDLSSIPSGVFIINFKTSNQSTSYKLQKL